MLSWLNRRLRNRMSGGVRGRKSLNQRNFLLLDMDCFDFLPLNHYNGC